MPIRIGEHEHWRTLDSFYYGDYITHGYTNANYAIEKHSQAFYELNIITRGSGIHYFGEQTYSARMGDVFIIPPNILHGYEGGEGFDVYHLLLSPSYMLKNSASLHRLPAYSTLFHIDPMMRERVSDDLHLHLEGNEFAEISAYLKLMESVDADGSVYDGITSEALATLVITKLCELYSRHGDSGSERGDEAFLLSISYIYEHYNENIEIEQLLRIARMSRTSYLDRFKRTTGTTPGRFQAQRRAEMARQMLDDPSRSLSDIAAAVGCFDTSHLIRLFKKHTGMTPSEYRSRQ